MCLNSSLHRREPPASPLREQNARVRVQGRLLPPRPPRPPRSPPRRRPITHPRDPPARLERALSYPYFYFPGPPHARAADLSGHRGTHCGAIKRSVPSPGGTQGRAWHCSRAPPRPRAAPPKVRAGSLARRSGAAALDVPPGRAGEQRCR